MTYPVVTASQCLLNDLHDVILQIPSDRYANISPILSGSSIGQHVRHILEFYDCLLDQAADDLISYGLRKRDMVLESDPSTAARHCLKLASKLTDLTSDKGLSLAMELPFDGVEDHHVQTTLLRELVYCLEHAIHHMAIIRIGLQIMDPTILLADNFGVAPSTLKYRESLCAQ